MLCRNNRNHHPRPEFVALPQPNAEFELPYFNFDDSGD
jgi:hypothetical protein